MEDIKLSNEDFLLGEVEKGVFDLVLESEDYLTSLIKKALITPLNYIGRYVIDKGDLDIIDYNFGNAIYQELSEGLTINFISRIKQHVTKAIEELNSTNNKNFFTVNIAGITVDLVDFESVDIKVFLEDSTVIDVNVEI